MCKLRTSGVMVVLVGIGLCLGCNDRKKLTADKRFEIPPEGYAVSVESSGSEQVDRLVRQLVSQRPAPYRSGHWDTPVAVDIGGRYCTHEVDAAFKSLKELGPAAFPALVKHLRDDRYSYSFVSEAWLNQSVGDAIEDVLDDGHNMHSGYKFRETPSRSGGGYLSFHEYLDVRGPENWAEWSQSKSRLDIQMDFIDWCIVKENERGYVDEKQKEHILQRYEDARQQMRKEYSEQARAAGGNQAVK